MNIITKAPKRFEDASLNRSGNTEAIQEIKKFISSESMASGNIRRCLILSGSPGTGKTFSLYALLNSCREDREIRQVALQLDGSNSSFGKVQSSVWQPLSETKEDR